MANKQKKIGRPKKAAQPGTTVALGVRVPANMKARIDTAADAAGRSQSEEVARRLEASFELQPVKEIFSLVEGINNGAPWNETPESSLMAAGLIEAYLRSVMHPDAREYVADSMQHPKIREQETKRLDKAFELLREKLGVAGQEVEP